MFARPAFRFTYPLETEAWVLRGWSEGDAPAMLALFQMVARLRPGVSPAQAQAELTPLLGEALCDTRLSPAEIAAHAPLVVRVADHVSAGARPGMLLLFAGAGLVMLIACVNVALLLLAAMVDRQHEMALRAALGAGWPRLVRQVLAESALLAAAGAVLGLAVAWALLPALRSLVPASIPRGAEASLDPATLAFTAALTILTVVACSLPPALQARARRLHAALQQVDRTVTADRRAVDLRRAAIAAQTTVVFVLLVAAALLLHSFSRLQLIDPGFEADGLVAVKVQLRHPKYRDPEQTAAFDRAVLERVRAVPGVAQASLATTVPARGAARAVDPEQPIDRPGTIDGIIREQVAQDRFQTVSTAAFAPIALLLASAGLAGAVARSVGERTREIAVRGALGAAPEQLVSQEMRQGLQPVAVGLALGLLGAIAASRALAGFLFEVSPASPASYAAAAAALAFAAVAACHVPARRAARVDPAVALRAE